MLLKFHKTSNLGNKSSFGNCFQNINLRVGNHQLQLFSVELPIYYKWLYPSFLP